MTAGKSIAAGACHNDPGQGGPDTRTRCRRLAMMNVTSAAPPQARAVRPAGDNGGMNPSYSYGGFAADTADRTRTLFGQVMWYVAATAGVFALGSYLGRDLSHGVAIIAYIAAFACLIGMNFAVRRSAGLTTGLLLGFGILLGLALSPTLTFYAAADPRVLWQAGGATALFIAGFGAAGYATRRDLSGLGRVCFWALLALIVLGIVLIFVHVPGGSLIYSILGLVIFAGLTMFDFQRLRRSKNMDSAPLIAASIFLDALNVFLFFLRIFSRSS
jgi:FtsH-binding integral membrane protein